MTHTYNITGMTCDGCRSGVENKLKNVPGVITVHVSLEKNQADIEMERHISTQTFQNALPEKYTIMLEEKIMNHEFQQNTINNETESIVKQLFPLILILGYITITAILMNIQPFDYHNFMLDFMGIFYIVFSFFKMLDLQGFPSSFAMYDPIAKRVPFYGKIYPFIETILGIMFLMRFNIDIALIATIVILGATTIGVAKVLLDKKTIQCACLGTVLKLPMTKATIIENSIMLIMAVLMLMT